MSPPRDFSSLTNAEKDALIGTLLARVDALLAENAELRRRVGELETKLGLPPKTPDNSSTPPSQGHKASGEASSKAKGKAHAGAHRALHPNPTRKRDMMATRRQHCAADVSAVVQTAQQSYDRIEIPEIKPDVTRVTALNDRGAVPKVETCYHRIRLARAANDNPYPLVDPEFSEARPALNSWGQFVFVIIGCFAVMVAVFVEILP